MKKGFTITETVLAIGIIGLLSVLMIPIIQLHKNNTDDVMSKKSFHMAGQILEELANNEQFYNSAQGFADVREVTYGKNSIAGGTSKLCKLFASQIAVNGSINTEDSVTLDDGGNFTTIDGMTWSMPFSNFSDGVATISVDVNGADGENCFSTDNGCNNPDRYLFYVDKFGRVSKDEDDLNDRNTTPASNSNGGGSGVEGSADNGSANNGSNGSASGVGNTDDADNYPENEGNDVIWEGTQEENGTANGGDTDDTDNDPVEEDNGDNGNNINWGGFVPPPVYNPYWYH